jgi:hypothetical protein
MTATSGLVTALKSPARCTSCKNMIPARKRAWVSSNRTVTCMDCFNGDQPTPDPTVTLHSVPTGPDIDERTMTATIHTPTSRTSDTSDTDDATADISDTVATAEADTEATVEADTAPADTITVHPAADRTVGTGDTGELDRTAPDTLIPAPAPIDAHLHAELDRTRTELDTERAHRQRILTAAETKVAELTEQITQLTDATAATNELQAELDQVRAELDTERAQQAADAQHRASTKNLDRIVLIGTGIVLVAVAVLTYVGGVISAVRYAHWPIGLAVLVPLCVEAGAAVELAGLVRDRRHNQPSHWSAKMLATGLLGASITAMVLHATNAPAGAHAWWAYTLAVGLPLELAALVRASLGGDHKH